MKTVFVITTMLLFMSVNSFSQSEKSIGVQSDSTPSCKPIIDIKNFELNYEDYDFKRGRFINSSYTITFECKYFDEIFISFTPYVVGPCEPGYFGEYSWDYFHGTKTITPNIVQIAPDIYSYTDYDWDCNQRYLVEARNRYGWSYSDSLWTTDYITDKDILRDLRADSIFEEGKTWVVDHTNGGEEVYATYTYVVRGDSVVDGINYKKVYVTSKENLEDLDLYYLARDENGVAYFRENDKEYVFFDIKHFGRQKNPTFERERTDFYYKGFLSDVSMIEGCDGFILESHAIDVYIYDKNNDEAEPFVYHTTFVEGVGEASHGIELDYSIGVIGGAISKLRCVHDADGTHIYGNGEGCKTLSIELIGGDSGADDAIYDLTGRKLNVKPEKGVYIQGGKKYIEKN